MLILFNYTFSNTKNNIIFTILVQININSPVQIRRIIFYVYGNVELYVVITCVTSIQKIFFGKIKFLFLCTIIDMVIVSVTIFEILPVNRCFQDPSLDI